MKKNWIVVLEDGVYLAPWGGDPGRTLNRKLALKYSAKQDAELALSLARQYRPFKNARIERVSEPKVINQE